MNTMKWLIRREFWEHKGGLLWAPVVVGAIMVAVVMLSLAIPLATGKHAQMHVQIGNANISQLSDAASALSQPHVRKGIEDGLSALFLAGAMPMSITLSFVIFFYFINTLYEDRSNRSALFWKSLPIADRDTVLSKLATGLVLAPFLSWVAALVVGLAITLLVGFALLVMGINVFPAVLSNPRTYTLPFEYLAIGPVYILWALPTAGWLMMVSAWAKNRPFLWAVGVPVMAGVLVAWSDQLFDLGISAGWFMQHVVARLLFSIAPGSWATKDGFAHTIGVGNGSEWQTPLASWQLLATPELWIGVILGALMLVTAIRLRRYRDEG